LKNICVYPGTFDPITNGHLEIIKRSVKLFDRIIIMLANNPHKSTTFSLSERVDQIRRVVQSANLNEKVSVDCFDGLLVDYCREHDINIIIRGLRPLVDFEYEFEMAMTNKEMNNNIETVFILTDQKYFYLRSTLIKDIAKLGGDISGKVPDVILSDILTKYSKK